MIYYPIFDEIFHKCMKDIVHQWSDYYQQWKAASIVCESTLAMLQLD